MTFDNSKVNLTLTTEFAGTAFNLGLPSYAQLYQSYLALHARSSDPNTHRKRESVPPTIQRPRPFNSGDAIAGIFDATNLRYKAITKRQPNRPTCEFWQEPAFSATKLGGSKLVSRRVKPPSFAVCKSPLPTFPINQENPPQIPTTPSFDDPIIHPQNPSPPFHHHHHRNHHQIFNPK